MVSLEFEEGLKEFIKDAIREFIDNGYLYINGSNELELSYD